jgi:IS605 OrfB family transposase
LGIIPVLRRPICQWNNQNWRIEGDTLLIPVCQNGQVRQISIRCSGSEPLGSPGVLRIKRKRGKWVADVAYTLPETEPTTSQGVMGVDLGLKVPAVVHISNKGACFFGNGRQQRAKRRQFYGRRKALQQAKKVRAVRKSQGKEQRWMRDTNHQLSHKIVAHAQAQGVGIIRMERLAGIRQRTARTSRGAKARKNNRMMASWTFHQLAEFIAYKAARAGIVVEWVDPAHTSQMCPACFELKRRRRSALCLRALWLARASGCRGGYQHQSQDWPAWSQRRCHRSAHSVARPVDGPPETARNCEVLIPKAKATEGERIRTSRMNAGESQWNQMDTWYEEDEQAFAHARDPYKLIDVRQSARHVRVVLAGETVAETRRPKLLFETELPVRYYIAPEDVRMDLLKPTATASQCAYKGQASYWSARVGERVFEDVAWCYRDPLALAAQVAGMVCFFQERVDAVVVDGQPVERPQTPWAR